MITLDNFIGFLITVAILLALYLKYREKGVKK